MSVWEVIVPLLVYIFVNNVFVILGLGGISAEQIYWQTAVKMTGVFLGGVAVFPFYKREERFGEKLDKKIFRIKEGIVAILTGSLLGVGLNLLLLIVGFTGSSESYQKVAESQFSVPLWLAIIFYGALSPVVEEMVFRGIVYRSLKRMAGPGMAVIGSALLFGGIHGNLVQMIYGGIMGAVFAVAYEKYGSLKIPVLLHSSANIAVYLLTY